MRTVVAVAALGLLLSGVSVPSAQATELPHPHHSLDEQLADLPSDSLPPLCALPPVEEESAPGPAPSDEASFAPPAADGEPVTLPPVELSQDLEEPPSPVSTCPVPPTQLLAQEGINEVRLSWSTGVVPADDDRYTDPVAYYVSVSGPESQVVRTTDTTLTVQGLRNGVAYSFEVFAATAAGRSTPAGPATATPTTGMEGVVAGLIVEFVDGIDPQPGDTTVPGDERVPDVDLVVAEKVTDEAVLVELAEPVDLDTAMAIAADLAADERVEWAEPDQFFFTSSGDLAQSVSVPADSQYASNQWNLWDRFGVGVGDGSTSMSNAWAGSRGDRVTVAVIDTGVTSHPDLDSQLVSGFDFVSNPEQLASSREADGSGVAFDGDYVDEASFGALGRDSNPADPGDWRGVAPVRDSSWHGTKVAGIIAAASNADGITGVAPAAKIQPIRALSWRGGLLSDIAASITWASGGSVDGVPANPNPSNVINMSFAVESVCPTALQRAIDSATSRGAILVAAAGNASDDAIRFAPGNCDGVITVAATDRGGQRAGYSNYGATIDVAAPGGDSSDPITTTSNTGGQAPVEATTASGFGTSMAAAHVSAAAAILASRDPALTPSDAFAQITGSEYTKAFNSQSCDSANPDYSCGAGILSLAQVASVAGDTDYAMTFNGTTQYATTGNIPLSTALTMEAWTLPTSTCTLTRQLVILQEGSYSLFCDGGTWRYGYKTGLVNDPWVEVDSGIPVQNGVWQHIAVTKSSGGLATFFVNGSAVKQTAGTPAWALNGQNTAVGAYYHVGPSPSEFFSGRIDEVRLFNSDRSASILTDMNTYGPTNASGLLAYYDFNEGSGGTVFNRASSGGFNLTTFGTPTFGDVKTETSTSTSTVVTFPRSYLTSLGGWAVPAGVTRVKSLVVGGGGGGGYDGGGGGGGGGVVSNGAVAVSGQAVGVVVGQGGLGGRGWGPPACVGSLSNYAVGCSGGNGGISAFSAVTASGGGGGGGVAGSGSASTGTNPGGGGGGGSQNDVTGASLGGGGTFAGGSVADTPLASGNSQAAGGGGAAGVGANGGPTTGGGIVASDGAGGAGVSNSLSGVSTSYGAGGGGGDYAAGGETAPAQDGGGKGGFGATSPTPGASGRGGGGGGGSNAGGPTTYTVGGSGGSGIVIVSFGLPGAPTGVTGLGGEGKVTVSWTAPASVGDSALTGYTVTQSTSSGGTYSAVSAGTCTSASLTTAVSCTVTGLTTGTSYYFRVAAINGSGTGSFSNASGAVVPTGPLARFTVTAVGGGALGTQTAGVSFPVKVTAEDSAGRTYTDFTGTVNITSSSIVSAGAGPTAAFTAGVLASHNVTLTRAGASQTVTATQTGGAITGTSASFTISPASSVAQLTVLTGGDDSAVMGTALAIAPTVEARDAFNNTVPNAPITFSVTAGGGTLATPVTVNTNSSGVATAPAWTLGTTVGTLNNQLQALNGSVTVVIRASATSRPISITASSSSVTLPTAVTQSYSISSGSLGGSDAISAVTYSYTGTGGTVYGPSPTPPTAAGTYQVIPTALTFSPGAASNYTITYVPGTVTITQATQSLTFAAIADDTLGRAPILIAPTASSGLPVTVTSNSPSVCAVTSTSVSMVGAGTCSVTASQPGNATYSAAASITRTFAVSRASQAPLVIISDDTAVFGTSVLVMTTGGSGSGVLSVTPTGGSASGCSLSGASPTSLSLTSTSIGTCVVTASKADDTNYLAATAVTKTVTVVAAPQTIAFTTSPPLIPRPFGSYSVAAVSSSGLPVTLAITTGSPTVCQLSVGTISFLQAGTCTVTATQAGNGNYLAAPSVTQTIAVGRLNQSITFAQPVNVDFGDPAFALTATASSGLPVVFSRDDTSTTNAACAVDDTGVVTVLAVGACGVTARQAGDGAYAAAPTVTRVFQVVTAAASAPYITGVNVQNGGATLTFTVPGFTGGAPIAGYQVNAYPDGGGPPVTFTGCPTTVPLECTMPGLTNGVGYRFTVQAINAAGLGAESPLVPALGQPAITSVVRAAAVGPLIAVRGDTQLRADWSPLTIAQLGGGSFTRYDVRIARAVDDSMVATTVLNQQSDNSYLFTGLENGTSYRITVVAITTANASALEGNTAVVTEIPARQPDPVTGTYVPTSGTTGTVSWPPPVSDGGSPVLQYRVRLSTAGATVVDDTFGPGVFSSVVSGLTRGVGYSVTMTVTNAVGSSDDTHSMTQPNVPSAPVITAVAAATVDDSAGFQVTWTTPANNGAPITGYEVTATQILGRSGAIAPRVAATYTCTSPTTSCIIFAPGTARSYSYVVQADNLAGAGQASAPFVVPDPPGPTPPPPTPVPPVPPSPQPLPGPVGPGDIVIDRDGSVDEGATGGPNAAGDGLVMSGSGYSMTIQALGADRRPIPLGPTNSLIAYTGQRIEVTGAGLAPASYVAAYVLNPLLATRSLSAPVRLGTVLVGADGTFTGSWPLPRMVSPGQYVLQVGATVVGGDSLTVDVGLTVISPDQRALSITGNRVKNAQPAQVRAYGRALDLNGERVTARVKLQGQTRYVTGSSRVVADGQFEWQRKTGKKVYVYFQGDGIRSNRIIIGRAR